MKRNKVISACILGATALGAMAYDIVWVRTANGINLGFTPENAPEISYNADRSGILVNINGQATEVAIDAMLEVVPGVSDGRIAIIFGSDGLSVDNPLATDGVAISADGDKIVITDSGSAPLTIAATGTTGAGQIKVYSSNPVTLILTDLNLTNDKGSVINLQTSEMTTIVLNGDNTLSDSKKYNTPDGESEKATITATSNLTIAGEGSLTVTGIKKHGICSDGLLTVSGGNITIASTASDGLHSVGFSMTDGNLSIVEPASDGIDADTGEIAISGGKIDVTIPTADTKGIKADGNISIIGGNITVNVPSDQSKGIRTKADITISAGSLTFACSGNAVVVDADPSYCTAIKVDGILTIAGGSINISSTGLGGKGISVDGDCFINGGEYTIECNGNGQVYTDINGNNDTYSSTCITVDGNLTINAGTFNLRNAGTAGKCIKVDGELVIGTVEAGPTISAHTTGARISESQGTNPPAPGAPSQRPGGGWGPGGGGFDPQADYANPKVIKAQGNLTVNSGNLTLSSSQDGGEGLESKKTLTINGGTILINTYDDCINAANHVQFNGGMVRCIATGNDAVDSNGTMTIAGGIIIACGARAPEEGFDCDNNRFSITGGIAIGYGGATSNPTTSACTQHTLVWSVNLAKDSTMTLTDASGYPILSFTSPISVGTGKMVITSPLISTGSYKLYTSGTISGGETFEYLTTGADSYTPGTLSKSFTVSSIVTNI